MHLHPIYYTLLFSHLTLPKTESQKFSTLKTPPHVIEKQPADTVAKAQIAILSNFFHLALRLFTFFRAPY